MIKMMQLKDYAQIYDKKSEPQRFHEQKRQKEHRRKPETMIFQQTTRKYGKSSLNLQSLPDRKNKQTSETRHDISKKIPINLHITSVVRAMLSLDSE